MIFKGEQGYIRLLETILTEGDLKEDRTGVGTYSLFGEGLEFDLQEGFPLLTTKKVAYKPILSELLWFIEGSGDERRLAEILYGKHREELVDKRTIWTDNAQAEYWKPKASFNGDLGRVYGTQWRSWFSPKGYDIICVDQIDQLVKGLKDDPHSRRHILTAWNPGELDSMALPPCHMMSQFYVSSDKKLSCQMYQRSADMFLGVPFNIASYATLVHILAHLCGYEPGKLTLIFGDCHIYTNHVEQVSIQLLRKPYDLPQLTIKSDVYSIDNLKMSDFKIKNYNSHETIKAPMAV